MQRLIAIISIAFLVVLIIFFVSVGSSPDESTTSSEDESTSASQEIPQTAETPSLSFSETTNTTEASHVESLAFVPEGPSNNHSASVPEAHTETLIPSTPSGSAGHTTTNERSCGLSINRTATAVDVSRREPVGISSVFSANDVPVYVFMEVDNTDGPEREMTIRWNHLDSDHVFEQTIPAGVSPTWRTWVYHIVRPQWTGRWHVEILAPGSCPVAELYFEAV